MHVKTSTHKKRYVKNGHVENCFKESVDHKNIFVKNVYRNACQHNVDFFTHTQKKSPIKNLPGDKCSSSENSCKMSRENIPHK